jgi:hypothetical protein
LRSRQITRTQSSKEEFKFHIMSKKPLRSPNMSFINHIVCFIYTSIFLPDHDFNLFSFHKLPILPYSIHPLFHQKEKEKGKREKKKKNNKEV